MISRKKHLSLLKVPISFLVIWNYAINADAVKNLLLKEYILPDYKNIKHGFLRTPETKLNKDSAIINLINSLLTTFKIYQRRWLIDTQSRNSFLTFEHLNN